MARKKHWEINRPFVWWAHVPYDVYATEILSATVAHDPWLYASTYGSTDAPASLHAIDIATGDVRWSVVSATDGIGGVAGAGPSGPIFWQRGEGVRGYDAATGRELWRRADATSSHRGWTGETVPVVVGPELRTLALLDARTGRSLWEVACASRVWPWIRAGDLFICRGGYADGQAGLQARRVVDGALVWSLDTTVLGCRPDVVGAVDTTSERIQYISTDGDTVLATASGGRVIAVSAADGAVKWVSCPRAMVGPAAVRVGGVIACQMVRDYASLDPNSGAVLTRRSGVAKGSLHSEGCEGAGHFWFSDSDELVALVPETGEEYCRLRLPDRGVIPMATGRRLIVPLRRSLVCVDLEALGGAWSAGAGLRTE